MIELNRIYNEDCMRGLKRIDDKTIDMILTDLPYGTTDNKWDKCLPLDELFCELNRVIKDNGCMAFTAQQPFETDLINANRRYFRYEWVWDKVNPTGFLNAKKMPLRRHENVVIFYKRLPTYNPQFTQGKPYKMQRGGRNASKNYGDGLLLTDTENVTGMKYPMDIIDIPQVRVLFGKGEVIHPTQKPQELFEYFIKTYTNEGDVVLDCCMGSGTTAAACIATGRRYIGFETDEGYYNMSMERLAQGWSGGIK